MSFDLGPALLFCPADRPERYRKALERSDAVVLDLEDAVRPDARPAARVALAEHPLDPDRVIVRVNPLSTPDHDLDLEVVHRTGYRRIMLAKTEGASGLDALSDFDIVALCETAKGVVQASAIADHPAVVALMWGAEDLVASLGGSSSRDATGDYRGIARHARSAVLLAAGAAGKAAVDTVHLDIDDLGGLAAEAADAVASGFAATACIHPSQVETIRRAYAPSVEEVASARDLLDAAAGQHGVFSFRGAMVDEPLLRQARRVISRSAV